MSVATFRKQTTKELLSGSVERAAILTLHQQITRRIFDEGKDAKGSQIGTYSQGYMRARRKKGFGGSRKVVLEFTGQMRNDFSVIEVDGNLASGFKNDFNGKKSYWVETTYGKDIFLLTESEVKLLEDLIDKELQKIAR